MPEFKTMRNGVDDINSIFLEQPLQLFSEATGQHRAYVPQMACKTTSLNPTEKGANGQVRLGSSNCRRRGIGRGTHGHERFRSRLEERPQDPGSTTWRLLTEGLNERDHFSHLGAAKK
jgi:hypothetical protein